MGKERGASQAELARRAQTSLSLVARAVNGGQMSAVGRARIVSAINARRAEVQQAALNAADIFPTG